VLSVFTSFRDRALIPIEVARKGGMNCDPLKIIPETLNQVYILKKVLG